MFGKVSSPKYPENCEKVMYSNYHTYKITKSNLIEGLMLERQGRGILNCPRCSETLSGLHHAEDTICPECNLHMQVYGNALYLWEGGTVIDTTEEGEP